MNQTLSEYMRIWKIATNDPGQSFYITINKKKTAYNHKLFIKNQNVNGHIFGYIDPSTEYVNSKIVPLKYAETYGTKNGITHFDIFGYLPTGSEYTWIYKENKIFWYSKPDEDLKIKVEDHLFKRYGLENIKHNWT